MRSFFSKQIFKIRESYWLKSGSIVLVTRVSQISFGFISFLILIRFLDVEDFGVWVIFMTITSMIETVRVGFLKSPLMILHSDKRIDQSILYRSSFLLNICLSLVIIIVTYLAIISLEQLTEVGVIKKLFTLFFLKLIIISFSDHYNIVQETNLEFKGTFKDNFSRNLVFTSFVALCFIFGYEIKLPSLVLFQILGCSLGLILTISNSVAKQLQITLFGRYSIEYLKQHISYGKFTFGSSLVSIASRNIDTWFLGLLISPTAVAIYNPALRVSNIFEIPSSTVTSILLPKLTKQFGKEGTNSFIYFYERSIAYTLLFMIPVVAICYAFSDQIIHIIVGKGYEESADLLRITIFFGLIVPFNRQFSIFMDSIGKPKNGFYLICLNLILSIILHYIFIVAYGTKGAAYGSLLAYTIVFLITQLYLKTKHGISIARIFELIVSLSVNGVKKSLTKA